MSLNKRKRNIPAGDYVTDQEAVMDRDTEIQTKCETIDEVVKDKIFTLSEALEAYDVTLEQYLGYVMMQGRRNRKILADKSMIVSMVQIMFSILDFSSVTLDTPTRNLIKDMRQLSGKK